MVIALDQWHLKDINKPQVLNAKSLVCFFFGLVCVLLG